MDADILRHRATVIHYGQGRAMNTFRVANLDLVGDDTSVCDDAIVAARDTAREIPVQVLWVAATLVREVGWIRWARHGGREKEVSRLADDDRRHTDAERQKENSGQVWLTCHAVLQAGDRGEVADSNQITEAEGVSTLLPARSQDPFQGCCYTDVI
jgi:hypothetical protein